jgi:hypothetical protein
VADDLHKADNRETSGQMDHMGFDLGKRRVPGADAKHIHDNLHLVVLIRGMRIQRLTKEHLQGTHQRCPMSSSVVVQLVTLKVVYGRTHRSAAAIVELRASQNGRRNHKGGNDCRIANLFHRTLPWFAVRRMRIGENYPVTLFSA